MSVPDIHRIKRAIILGCLSFLGGTFMVFSQKVTFEPVYYNITTEHGLPSLETYSVKQDSKGYIWICTDAGVCRYDGFEFRTFTTRDGLTDNVVFDTYEDHKGRIWFLTYNSMLCYWDKGKISEYTYNDRIRKYLGNRTAQSKELFFDERGSMYYSLYTAGIIKIDTNGGIELLDNHEEDFVVLQQKKRLLISRWCPISGTKNFDKLDILVHAAKDEYKKVGVFNNLISFGTPQHKKGIKDRYFFIDNKVYDYYDLSNGPIIHISGLLDLQFVDSVLWLSTLDGLHLARKFDDEWHIFETCLKGFAITGITFDISGDVWVATLDKGVLFIPDMEVAFAGEKQGFTVRDTYSIAKWQDNIWVSGIETIKNLKGEKMNATEKYAVLPKMIVIGKNMIISDRNVCFDDYGLSPLGNNKYGMDKFHKLLEYKGSLIACAHRIVIRCDTKTKKFEYLYRSPYSGMGAEQYIVSVTADSRGQLLVGSKTEVYYLKKGKLHPMKLPGGIKPDVVDMIWDARWGLVIATTNDGIILFKNGKLKRYNEENGLLSNRINCISMDKDGTLYVGTPIGISIVQPNGKLGRFGLNDAMGNIDVNVIFPSDNTIYVGTKTGLLKISRGTLRVCMEPFKMADVRTKYIGFDQQQQRLSNKIITPSNLNLLKIDFSVLQFDNWFSKKYQYRIGKEGQWVDIESPSVSLYRPSGEFDIEIRYMDAYFQWSDPVKLCHVKVLLPFWMRWYFWTLIGLLGAGFIFYLYQRQQKRINLRLMRENQILQLEQQMLLQQQQMEHARMNPHFIFNVLNSIHSYILHEETDQAEKYLMMFSRLMREILIKAKEVGISIVDEQSVLTKYLELEQLRFKGKFMFEIQVNEEDRELVIPSMFVQPFVENAIIHGLSKTTLESPGVFVRFESKGHHYMKVTVCNSGAITEENLDRLRASGNKNAFGITKKRLENYNTLLKTEFFGIDVVITEGEKPTTCIVLRIPIL